MQICGKRPSPPRDTPLELMVRGSGFGERGSPPRSGGLIVNSPPQSLGQTGRTGSKTVKGRGGREGDAGGGWGCLGTISSGHALTNPHAAITCPPPPQNDPPHQCPPHQHPPTHLLHLTPRTPAPQNTTRSKEKVGAGGPQSHPGLPPTPPSRPPRLTPTTTLSSPWKTGRNRSPRRISAWFRGRKRHSTLMLHSAPGSAMPEGGRGGVRERPKGAGWPQEGAGGTQRDRGGVGWEEGVHLGVRDPVGSRSEMRGEERPPATRGSAGFCSGMRGGNRGCGILGDEGAARASGGTQRCGMALRCRVEPRGEERSFEDAGRSQGCCPGMRGSTAGGRGCGMRAVPKG